MPEDAKDNNRKGTEFLKKIIKTLMWYKRLLM